MSNSDIPVRFQTILKVEDTGFTYDNVDGVKINLEYIKCLTWFHPLKYEMTDTLQVAMFMTNMEPGVKSYLATKTKPRKTVFSFENRSPPFLPLDVDGANKNGF